MPNYVYAAEKDNGDIIILYRKGETGHEQYVGGGNWERTKYAFDAFEWDSNADVISEEEANAYLEKCRKNREKN